MLKFWLWGSLLESGENSQMRLWTATNQGNWLVTRIHDMFWGFGAPQTSGGGETWFTGVHPDLIWSQVSMTKMKKIGLKICPEIDFFLTSIGKPGHGKSIGHVFFHFWLKIRCQLSSNISLQRAKSAKNMVLLRWRFHFLSRFFDTLNGTSVADGCRSLPSFSGRLCSKIDWVRAFPGASHRHTGLWAVQRMS